MNLSVKGQHVDVGDALRAHIEEKLESLKSKYFNRVTDVTVLFSKPAEYLFRANLSFHVGHDITVQAKSENQDPYTAFDEAAERVGKQLRRYKTRLRDHHERLEKTPDTAFLTARDYILQTEGVDIGDDDAELNAMPPSDGHDHLVIAEMALNIPSLSVSDAVMRMDLADQDFLLFKNPKAGTLNVVYRRPDGNIGWIDPALADKSASHKDKVKVA